LISQIKGNLFVSPNIIVVITSRRMRWAEGCSTHDACKSLNDRELKFCTLQRFSVV